MSATKLGERCQACFSTDVTAQCIVCVATVIAVTDGWQLLDVENGVMLEKGLHVTVSRNGSPIEGGAVAHIDRDRGVFTTVDACCGEDK